MDPLPSWLEDTIAAAGITAYAFDVDREANIASTPVIPAPDPSRLHPSSGGLHG